MPMHNSDEGNSHIFQLQSDWPKKYNIEMRPGESHVREQQHSLKYKFAQHTRNWLLLSTVR